MTRLTLLLLVVAIGGCGQSTVREEAGKGYRWIDVGRSECLGLPFDKAICWGDRLMLMPELEWPELVVPLNEPTQEERITL